MLRLGACCLGALAAVAARPAAGAAQAPEDDPLRRWRFFIEQRRYPGIDALGRRLQAARRSVLLRAVSGAPSPASAVEGSTWTPLGPERIPIFGTSTGRVSAVTLNPVDPDVLYAGGAQGGVWTSDDAGASWRPLTDEQCSLAMGAIAIDPVAPDIVFAGTGEQHFSGDSYYGCGMLRSLDGGETWSRTEAFGAPSGPGPSISRVRVDPATAGTASSTVVWAATSVGLHRSEDSGGSWTRTLDGVVTDLVLHPEDPSVLWAAVLRQDVYRSTDGGITWTPEGIAFPSDPGRINLATASSDGDVVYAVVADPEEGDLLGIWRTTDGGASWERRPASAAGCGFQCWYDLAIAVHPTDPDVVYFGGVSLYRSDDGAGSFLDILGSPPIHVDQHIITVDPRRPDHVWVGNDGGVYRSPDRGATWTSLNTGLALTQFYGGVSVDPSGIDGVLGGTQDNGTVQYGGGPEWAHVLGGDGGFTAIHPLRDRRWMETQWGGDYSGPRRSDFGGVPTQRIAGIDLSERAIFIPPLVMDPFDPDVLYFGTERLYRTVNGGSTWDVIGASFGGGLITAIAPARADERVVWVGTSSGEGWLTRDAGGTWMNVSSGLPRRYITDVAVHPTEPGRAWYTVSGFQSGHVFVASGQDPSFTDITGDLPDHPVNAVLLDPGDPDQVYLGTDLGVFASDGPGRWVRMGQGLPMVAVFDLAAEPNAGILVAGTHGRGAFYLPVSAPLELQLRSSGVSLSRPEGSGPAADEIPVGVYGTGWPGASWSAIHGGAPWLTLTSASGSGRGVIGWRVDPEGLWAGTYGDTLTVELDGVAGAAQELPFALDIPATHTAELAATARSLEVPEGASEGTTDSVAVTLEGPNPGSTSWSARHGDAAWLTLVEPGATGDGTLRWRIDPSGLPADDYVDTVTVGGPSVTPVELVLSLAVEEPFRAEPGADSRSVSVAQRSTEPLADSVAVELTGFGADDRTWVATHGGAPWLSLADSTGTGSGRIRWNLHAGQLERGTYLDTLTVLVDEGPTLRVVDSLIVREPLSISLGTAAGEGLSIAGVVEPVADSAVVELGGFGAGEARWVADVVEDSGIEIVRSEGGTGERVVWHRSARDLAPGIHVDSVLVRPAGSSTPPVALVHILRVEPDLSTDEAAAELLRSGTLSAGQREALDALGNHDGIYDLGDFLSWLDRCVGRGAACAGGGEARSEGEGG